MSYVDMAERAADFNLRARGVLGGLGANSGKEKKMVENLFREDEFFFLVIAVGQLSDLVVRQNIGVLSGFTVVVLPIYRHFFPAVQQGSSKATVTFRDKARTIRYHDWISPALVLDNFRQQLNLFRRVDVWIVWIWDECIDWCQLGVGAVDFELRGFDELRLRLLCQDFAPSGQKKRAVGFDYTHRPLSVPESCSPWEVEVFRDL